jgi:hypothetical protein
MLELLHGVNTPHYNSDKILVAKYFNATFYIRNVYTYILFMVFMYLKIRKFLWNNVCIRSYYNDLYLIFLLLKCVLYSN